MKPVAIYKDTSYGLDRILRGKTRALELWGWLALLIFCNHSLLQGRMAEQYVFLPTLVANGEWYRAVLSPFVHVSWYHLALDALAFLFLWKSLDGENTGIRWIYLLFCWAGCLLVPLLVSEQIHALGLCGLSGISHGLFAVSALELSDDKNHKEAWFIGWIMFAVLFAKIVWEMLSGKVFLAGFHLGYVGTPLVSSHLGGFLGGSLAYFLIRMACILNKKSRFHDGLPS
ncbi:MAG: rhombosortase [Deltaproteobacteria bacterium]|nr:rhombosortase [Deltaproteobacteria bacterium]